MAQIVGGVVGGVIGFYATGGTPQGAQFGFAVGSALGGAYAARQKRIEGPRLTDLRFPGTEYGQAIAWMIGGQRMAGQIWWASDKREIRTTTRQGKGGGPKLTTSSYEIDVLIGLLEEDGPGTALVEVPRVWANGKLVRNRLSGASSSTLATAFREDLWRRFTLYTGHESQLPDPTYEAAVGVGFAPAYRGRGCVFIEGLQLDGSGQLPVLTFEALTKAGSGLENPALTAIAIERNEYWHAGTAAFNNSLSEYMVPIATWTSALQTTVVNVYTISLDKQFVNDEFGGTFSETFELTSTFNASVAWHPAGHGNSDVPVLAQGESATVVAVYDVPSGARVGYVVGEDWRGHQMRFCRSGTAIVFTNYSVGSKRLRLFTVGTTTQVLASAALPDFVNSIAIVGGFVFAATRNTKEVYKIDLATMTLQATILRPSFSTDAADIWPLLTNLNGQLMLVGHNTATVQPAKVWTLNDDHAGWTQLAGQLPLYFDQSDNRNQSIGVVGSLLVGGLNMQGAPGTHYRVWTAPITVTAVPVTLREAVEAACFRALGSAALYDASALATIATPVRSAPMTQAEGVRGLLQQLQTAHNFECVLADKLYFRPAAGASARAIPYEDLGATEGSDIQVPLPLSVAAELEQPPKIAVQFLNAANDYQVGTEMSDRLVLTSQAEAVEFVQLGLAMTPAEAKAISDRLNARGTLALTTTALSLPLRYADVDPGDAVAVTAIDGAVLRFRLGRKSYRGGVIAFEGALDDDGTMVTDSKTDEDYVDSTVVASASFTLWHALDLPLLRDIDDGPGWVIAANGITTTWPGAQLLVSANGSDFAPAVDVHEAAVMGFCTTTLGAYASGPGLLDDLNTVTVNVGFGTLASSTHDAVARDRTVNVLRIGSEIVRFIVATQTGSSPNVYRLSRLLRGQLGTDWAMGLHVASDPCTLLRVLGGLRNVVTQVGDIGRLRYIKAVTLGTSDAGIAAAQFTDTGVKLKPYAPAYLVARRALSGLVTCSWERRTRLSYTWPSDALPAIGEATEAYELELLTPLTASSAAWNPADKNATITLSAADRTASQTAPDDGAVRGVTARSSTDHVYFEVLLTGADGRSMPGIGTAAATLADYPGLDGNGRGYWGNPGGGGGQKFVNDVGSAYGATHAPGDTIGVELKLGSLIFWKSVAGVMVSQGVAFTLLTGEWYPMWGSGTSVAGTRSAKINLGQDAFIGLPPGARAWGADPQTVVGTVQTGARTADLSAAAQQLTLPVAAAAVALVGSTYYGVDVEGNTNFTLRRLVAQTAAGVIAYSPYIGAVLVGAAYTATDAYTAAYYYSGQQYGNTFVERFSLANLTSAAANYAASIAGDVVGIAHDGTDLWVVEQFSLRLRRLNGTTLAVSETRALAGPIAAGLAHAAGLLFFIDSDDLVAHAVAGSPTEAWRTALPAGYGFSRDIVAVAGNVFVSTGIGVLVYDQATGALVLNTGITAYGASGAQPSLFVHGADVVCNDALSAQPIVVLDGATGAVAQRFAVGGIVDLYGSDGSLVIVSGQSSPFIVGADLARGFSPLGASLSGYVVRCYQMSAVVGRGYPAEATIP